MDIFKKETQKLRPCLFFYFKILWFQNIFLGNVFSGDRKWMDAFNGFHIM